MLALYERDANGGSGQVIDLALYQLSLLHIPEPTRLWRISYAVFCFKKEIHDVICTLP